MEPRGAVVNNYTLLKKNPDDTEIEIATEQARTTGEALMVFGRRREVTCDLELCDLAEAEFFLKWLNPNSGRFDREPVRCKR
jgi:hypothetical protein